MGIDWRKAYRGRHGEGMILATLIGWIVSVGFIGGYLALQANTDTTLMLRVMGAAIAAVMPLPAIEYYLRRPKNRSSY